MTLSCSCDFDCIYDWYYKPPSDYSVYHGKRRTRCSSCNELIGIDSTVAVFIITRPTNSWVEDKIYGEDGEVPMVSKILCEECADLYFSFQDLGFYCIAPDENMKDLLKQYQYDYG